MSATQVSSTHDRLIVTAEIPINRYTALAQVRYVGSTAA